MIGIFRTCCTLLVCAAVVAGFPLAARANNHKDWSTPTGIQGGRIVAPQNQRVNPNVPVKVEVGPEAKIYCATEAATDQDHWKEIKPDGTATGVEGDAPDGVKYTWSGPGTFADANSAGTAWTAPKDPGDYTLTVTIDDLWEDGANPAQTGVTAPDTGDRNDTKISYTVVVTVKPDIVVNFNPTPIKTGYTMPAANSTLKRSVTATVTPKAETNNIDLSVTGQARATIDNIQRDANAGTITFDVKGSSATPATEPGGDTWVEAKKNGDTKGKVPVIVVIPAAVGTPHPQAAGAVAGQNVVLDGGTSPGAPGLGAGNVLLATIYVHWQTVPVVDQFGATLDAIYAGVAVSEGGIPINQNMTAGGTYTDPVGVAAINGVVAAGSPAAIAWPAAAKLPMQANNFVQNIPVEVGGHALNPAVVNRQVNAAPPNVTITWP